MSDQGDPADAVVVRWAEDEFQGGLVAAKLDAAQIPARVVTDDPMGTTGFFGATASRRVAVVVARTDVDRAGEVLRKAEQAGDEADKIDWDRVDVGEPEDALARRIASTDESRSRGWWWGGWPAAIVLLAAGFVAFGFSSAAALVLWLAALIAGLGSAFSWVAWRLRNPAGSTPEDAP